jgi:hypothetical protein
LEVVLSFFLFRPPLGPPLQEGRAGSAGAPVRALKRMLEQR